MNINMSHLLNKYNFVNYTSRGLREAACNGLHAILLKARARARMPSSPALAFVLHLNGG